MYDRRWWVGLAVMAILVMAVVRIGVAALDTGRISVGSAVETDRSPVLPRVRLARSEFDSLVEVIRTSPPFQPSRALGGHPTMLSGDPTVPSPLRPMLHLGGMAGGTVPHAILYGIPGTQGGRVVQEGDTVGGLRVRSIRGGVVSVVGYDTAWSLSLKETVR